MARCDGAAFSGADWSQTESDRPSDRREAESGSKALSRSQVSYYTHSPDGAFDRIGERASVCVRAFAWANKEQRSMQSVWPKFSLQTMRGGIEVIN